MKTQHEVELYDDMNIKVSIRICIERETCGECRLIWEERNISKAMCQLRSQYSGRMIREGHRSWWLDVFKGPWDAGNIPPGIGWPIASPQKLSDTYVANA